MKPKLKDPSLTEREIRFYASNYFYRLAAMDKLSVSLLQRRFLLGFYAASQVHDYIAKAVFIQSFRSNLGTELDPSPLMELTLLTDTWLGEQLVKTPLSEQQVLQERGDVCTLTVTVKDSKNLDLWLLMNSDSILKVEKRLL